LQRKTKIEDTEDPKTTNTGIELTESKAGDYRSGAVSPSVVHLPQSDNVGNWQEDVVVERINSKKKEGVDPATQALRFWSTETTLRWITYALEGRFDYLTPSWAKQEVDGNVLYLLTEEELKTDLDVAKIGDRKAILKLIKELKEREIEKHSMEAALVLAETGSQMQDAENADQLDAIFVFRYLLVFTACLESFAHGSNDTANATGPFSAVYQFYTNGGKDCSSDEGTVWIMCLAGICVAIGVCTFGYRVIQTIGTNLTVIDFHKGFYIEVGSTLATMIATVMEFPVSTTHCQVGGVIGVGLVSMMHGTGKVSWGLFSKIFATWVLTLPIAGSISALVVMVIKGAIIRPDGNA
jgi:phosphate/sulfate permease